MYLNVQIDFPFLFTKRVAFNGYLSASATWPLKIFPSWMESSLGGLCLKVETTREI